jgi:hypothetical protein
MEVPQRVLEDMEEWELYDLDTRHHYRRFYELLVEIHRGSSERAEEIKTRKWHEQRDHTESQQQQNQQSSSVLQKYPSLGPSQGSSESRIPSASSLFGGKDDSAGGDLVRANTEKSCDLLVLEFMRHAQNDVFGNVMKLDFVERRMKLVWTSYPPPATPIPQIYLWRFTNVR